MKKYMLIALIAILTLAGFQTLCFAQVDRTVTNTSKKGSLLIWPLVAVGPGDTTIQLTNNYSKSVKVRCTYRLAFPPRHKSWTFTLKPNQPIAWRASTGKGPDGKTLPVTGTTPPPLTTGTKGELVCWAVDSSETQQIAWNWLTGDAIVRESNNQFWGYSAWRFAVNSSTNGANAGTAGQILLTGDSGNYDACPTALSFNFLKQTSSLKPTDIFPPGTVDTKLTLVSCSLDLKRDGNSVAYTQLLISDENGVTQITPSVCVGIGSSATQWFSESLSSTKVTVDSKNAFRRIETPGGSFSVHGRQNVNCTGSKGVPLLGVMSMQFTSFSGPFAGATPTALGPGQAYVKDANDNNTTDPISINW